MLRRVLTMAAALLCAAALAYLAWSAAQGTCAGAGGHLVAYGAGGCVFESP